MNRRKTAVSIAATTALGVSACGGGPTALGDDQAISNGKLTLAVVTDMSGTYSALTGKGSLEAVKMAVDDYQEKYGSDAVAQEIEVLSADHQNEPDIANTKARELFDRQGADAIFDVPSSAAALAVADLAEEFQRIYINVAAGSTDLTGSACNEYTYHWAYDTEMLARGSAATLTQRGEKNWYIVYPDYQFGQDMTAAFTTHIEANGGKVLGTDATPFPNDNFAASMTKALEIKPDVIATMAAGSDLTNFVKQYNEFGLAEAGIELAVGAMFDTDVESIGATQMSGTLYTTDWFWNQDDEAREWADDFKARLDVRPTAVHAGDYSAATQYLEAVQRAGTDDADAVAEELDGHEFEDMFARNARVRSEDHRMIHDSYLTVVKEAKDVQEAFDYTELVETIPADEAFGPPSSSCDLG
ncbi:ABC transporter substrate-binding protein [Nocardioides caldifontis]|uniref:ABC transporter substrate-binding protein n=1 Tax=Nocardioides caldifontis TaxID=2588938 RepID=UPI0011DF05AE|nr:ABC transporter substrate-binding protein [Nocardioides caldifontis]